MLVDREMSNRDTRRIQRLLEEAGFPESAVLEDLDDRPGRGMDKSLLATLAGCQWICRHQNLDILGATGGQENLAGMRTGHSGLSSGHFGSLLPVLAIVLGYAITHEKPYDCADISLDQGSASVLASHVANRCADRCTSRRSLRASSNRTALVSYIGMILGATGCGYPRRLAWRCE